MSSKNTMPKTNKTMGSKNLYLNIILRTCIIALSTLALAFSFSSGAYILGGAFSLFFMILVIELIHFLNKTNRKIAFFFNAIRNDDSTLHFPENIHNPSLKGLYASLNKVNAHIKNIKVELEEQEQYFQAILEHVTVGILTFNEKGNIFLANSSAKNLLNYQYLTHIEQLKRIDHTLYHTIKNIKAGERNLVSINTKSGQVQLSLKANLFKTSQEALMLLAIQDIKSELEEKELDSWIKLIRVLTHEIMNTIAPITSLSQTLMGYYKDSQGQLSPKNIDNTIKGLSVINERGTALISFVETYRKLTRLPKPNKKPVGVLKFCSNIITLFESDPNNKHISYKLEVLPNNLEISADEKQVSQVLINLLKNSSEALAQQEGGKVEVKGFMDGEGHVQITVADNGPGIPSDLLDKIFIPFFTTKDNGSGIGLSLSRQIMQLHGGNLKIVPQYKNGAFFTLTF